MSLCNINLVSQMADYEAGKYMFLATQYIGGGEVHTEECLFYSIVLLP